MRNFCFCRSCYETEKQYPDGTTEEVQYTATRDESRTQAPSRVDVLGRPGPALTSFICF